MRHQLAGIVFEWVNNAIFMIFTLIPMLDPKLGGKRFRVDF